MEKLRSISIVYRICAFVGDHLIANVAARGLMEHHLRVSNWREGMYMFKALALL